MRPLQLVDPKDLIPGKTYLIREKRPEFEHLKSKATFVKNDLPVLSYQCIRSADVASFRIRARCCN